MPGSLSRDRPSGDHFNGTYVPMGEPFSNRASVVNRLLDLRCIPGVTVLSAVGLAAATFGPKHRRCNVHNGLM